MTTTSQLLIYQTEGSNTRLEIWLEDETMRLQQKWVNSQEDDT